MEIDGAGAPDFDRSGALPFSGQMAWCRAVKDFFWREEENGCETSAKGYLAHCEQG